MKEIIRQKIIDSQAATVPVFTPRDIRLPRVPGKATAVIGMRRTGKTTFLWQVLAERLAGLSPAVKVHAAFTWLLSPDI